MTTPYSRLNEEPKQGATSPPGELKIDEGDEFISRGRPTARTTVTQNNDGHVGCMYFLLMIYTGIPISFSLFLGFFAFALAYYAWYEHKDGNPGKGVTMGGISFAIASFLYLIPITFVILLAEGLSYSQKYN